MRFQKTSRTRTTSFDRLDGDYSVQDDYSWQRRLLSCMLPIDSCALFFQFVQQPRHEQLAYILCMGKDIHVPQTRKKMHGYNCCLFYISNAILCCHILWNCLLPNVRSAKSVSCIQISTKSSSKCFRRCISSTGRSFVCPDSLLDLRPDSPKNLGCATILNSRDHDLMSLAL